MSGFACLRLNFFHTLNLLTLLINYALDFIKVSLRDVRHLAELCSVNGNTGSEVSLDVHFLISNLINY